MPINSEKTIENFQFELNPMSEPIRISTRESIIEERRQLEKYNNEEKLMKNNRVNYFYDQYIPFTFNFPVFFKELFKQSFFPFTRTLSRNYSIQNFTIEWETLKFPFSFYSFVILYIILVCSEINNPNNSDSLILKFNLNFSIIVPFVLFLLHRIMISIKYASLTSKEYDRYMDATDNDIMSRYKYFIHLRFAWGIFFVYYQ